VKYDGEVAAAIARWSPVYGVAIDPALVHAVIHRESTHGLALESVEPRGRRSYGPMMVLDTTAAGYGVKDPATLKAPGLGILYGVRYLAEQLRRFNGDAARAVSAYNAGPGNAVRGSSGRFPNQVYVDAVLGFWRRYRAALVGSGAAVAVVAAVILFTLWARRRAGGRRP